ncbi:UNVERIFIED_CONTAM: hypothetical protein FKN15_007658 [Acipenser sinensis]
MPGIVTTAPPRKGNQTPISLPWGLLNSCRHTPASHEPDSSAVDLSVLTILQILKGRVVVGHALHNDFRALGYDHPREMTRDTSRQRLLRLRAGLPVRASVSLRNLTKKLLNRDIQVGREGHCSVEDATAAMELYRLVEVQWEQEALSRLPAQDTHSDLSPSHYMNDQYWPEDLNMNDQYWPEGLNEDCQ